MNSYTEKGRSFEAGEALAKYRRVKKSGATVVYADAGEDSIGVTMHNAASGAQVMVKLFNDGGTFPIEAAAAITANAAVYGANDGKIDDTVSGDKLGTANEAATASGNIIEVLAATPANITAVQSLISDPADAAAITGSDPAACAAMTQNTLTDSGNGTADQTVEDVADIALSTSDTYADSSVNTAVNTAIASISNNFKEMTTELALIKTDAAALKTAIDGNNTAIDANIVDIAALRTAIVANNAAIESIIDALQANGIVATS